MARRTVHIEKTGETFVFDDEWNDQFGRVARLEYRLKRGYRVPSHLHPGTIQGFEVLAGKLNVSSNGIKTSLQEGARLSTGPGFPHSQWNEGASEVLVIETYSPALDIEGFFLKLPRVFACRNPLKQALFFDDHSDVVTSHLVLVRKGIKAMANMARSLGYSGWYRG